MRWPALLLLLSASGLARAESECRLLDLEFQPASGPNPNFAPQIVAWLEDASGAYVDTVYITQATGRYGLGNRPGRFDFNSGSLWPYGRRITTFPVWADKQPLRWPSVVFMNGNESNLSHPASESTFDPHYCQPLPASQFDLISCPTTDPDTDKGVLQGTDTSKYPPREDVVRDPAHDDASVDMYAMMNPFDAISQPTPPLDKPALLSIALSPEIPPGNYTLRMEVSREFDFNANYNETRFPPPQVTFSDYGKPYRGQPSVIYDVPITLSSATTTGSTLDYAFYSDPDGLSGTPLAADGTITTDVPGSGGGRLAILSSNGTTYRLRVTARQEMDQTPPDAARNTTIVQVGGTTATLSFTAPGDDFRDGTVAGYEVRARVGDSITEANFDSSMQVETTVTPVPAKGTQTIALDGLLPETTYSVGIRAFDNCRNPGPLAVIELTTTERTYPAVDACFVATAAYGSVMANDVELLRGFRDHVLSHSALGELAIETYYTFGPAVARFVGESELLRATARGALEPVVGRVRSEPAAARPARARH